MVDRRLASAAGAGLTATGGLAFARVFDSGAFVLPVVGAAVLPFALGMGLRRMRASAAVVVVTASVSSVVYALLAVQHWNPLRGLPDLVELERDLRAGWEVVRTEVPPVDPTSGTILVLVMATWGVAMVVDQMIERQATTGALAPPLALFVVAAALGSEQGPAVLVTVAFAVSACALLLFQQQLLIGGRRGTFVGRRVGTGSGLVVTGTTLGLVAVLVGVVSAPALPGASDEPLLDYRGFADDRGDVYEPGVLPVVDVAARLERGPQTELFRVRADQPAYWRLVALDQYQDNWTLDAPEGSIDAGLDEQAESPLVQEYEIGPLGERWMPAAYEARAVDGGDPLVIRESVTVLTGEDTVSGLSYTVESERPTSLAEVDADRAAATASPLPAELEDLIALPADLPDVITTTALEVTAGAATPFDQALALRDYFRGPAFDYDPNVRYNSPDLQDGEAVIVEFLGDKRGFCVQFAGAFALMARSLGIPTRMAVGFTPGERQGDEYVVTNFEAHAWPEVYLAGIGWTNMFDPTPPSDLAGGSALPGDTPEGGGSAVAPTTTTVAPPTTVPPTNAETPSTPPADVVEPAASGDDASRRWLAVALVPLALVVLAGAYLAAVLALKRRRRGRRRAASEPGAAVVGAWREVIDRLGEAKVSTPPTITPLELSGVLERDNAPAGRALSQLAYVYGAARYGVAELDRSDADTAWRHVGEFERALAADVSVTTRWRRRLTVRA